MMKELWFGLAVLCYGVCSGLVCDWDQSTAETQSVDPVALNALRLGGAEPMSPEDCRSACCESSDCDLVQVTFPLDGAECVLVKCWVQGQNQCVLQPRNDSQVVVYRKKVDPETRSAQDGAGETLQVVPLLLDQSNVATAEPNQTSDSICRQPLKVGSCRAAFPRFFYNVTEQSCSSFIYGGCEGNGNNFNSQEECETTCSGVKDPVLSEPTTPAPSKPPAKALRMAPAMPAQDHTELCAVEPSSGPCRAAFPRWFYNRKTGNCERFIYGGCGGNKNNYVTEESCSATCTVSVLPTSEDPSNEMCKASAEAGPCRAAFPRWFYNHRMGICEMFTYGGCGGNDNNFESRETCLATCSGSFDSHGERRRGWTPAFFLFVALAAIAALLLVMLIVVSLRRRKRSRLSSVSDKQVLLPEDKTSSLESLSIPDSPRPDVA